MAIRGFDKKDPMAGLNQLMQMMNQMNQMQDRKRRNFLVMEEELGKGLNQIYDNSQLELRKSHLDRYLDNNRDNMDEDTLSRFDLLNSQMELQKKANEDYTKGMEYSKLIGRKVEDSLVAYSNIQGMSKEQLNSAYSELYPDSNIDKSDEEKRSELREAAMIDVQRYVDSYSTFSGEFRNSHGERLGKAGFREDAAYLSNLKEMFSFGIVQAKDDFVFNSNEAEAMQLGIELGSYQPIQDYRTNEANRNRQIQSSQLKDLRENYNLAGAYQDIIDNANAFDSMSEEEKSKKRDMVWTTIGEEEITYAQYEEEEAIIDSIDKARDEAIQNVKNIDKSYNKREGVSWLQDNNIDTNISYQFEEKKPFIPNLKNIEKTDLKKEDDKKEIKSAPAIISKDDSEFFTEKGWTPVAGRSGKGWAAETTVKKEKLDEFMSIAFDPANFENGKIKEDSRIYKIIQRAKKGGSRRMRKVEQQLKRYAQGIKNLEKLKKEGFDPPSWANKLVNEVEFLLTTTKRRK
jgi:hypothetical protein